MNTELLDIQPRRSMVYGIAFTLELGLYLLAAAWAVRLLLG